MISPIVGGAIVLSSHFSSIFITSAIIGVVVFILSLFLPNTKEKAVLDYDDEFSLKAFFAVFKELKLMPWYLVTVVNMFFVSILFGFLPVRIYSLGYNPFITGLFMSIVALSYLLVQPIAGHFADKINPVITIRVGLILSAISIIFAPFVSGMLLVLVSMIAGIGVGTVWTNTDTLVSILAKDGRLGATMGAAGSFKEFGDMIGPILIGILSQFLGLTWGFVICGILGLLSLLIIGKHSKVQNR